MLAEDNVRTGFLEQAEFEAVREALPAHLRGVVTLAYFTAMRVKSETLTMQSSQVDREAKVIRLNRGTTKNKKGRVLPYGKLPELVTVIDTAWQAHEQLKAAEIVSPFVVERDGERVKDFRGVWETATETAGYPGKLLHDFRRTAVRNLVRRGVPEKTAMQITGHKTRSVFDRYDIVTERDIEAGLAKLTDQPAAVEPKRQRGKVRQFPKRTGTDG